MLNLYLLSFLHISCRLSIWLCTMKQKQQPRHSLSEPSFPIRKIISYITTFRKLSFSIQPVILQMPLWQIKSILSFHKPTNLDIWGHWKSSQMQKFTTIYLLSLQFIPQYIVVDFRIKGLFQYPHISGFWHFSSILYLGYKIANSILVYDVITRVELHLFSCEFL